MVFAASLTVPPEGHYFGGHTSMTVDGVHPNPFGSVVMAEIIETQVNQVPTW